MTQDYVIRTSHFSSSSVIHDVNCKGEVEAVLRFAGCNFSCIHCFSFASSWPKRWRSYKKKKEYSVEDVTKEIKSNLLDYSYCWLRITGGEPFLNLERGRELCSILKHLESNGESFRRNVVVQTNGLLLADSKFCSDLMTRLADVSLNVLIEISLKGTCREEFNILTQLPQNNFDLQLEAVDNLRRQVPGKSNLSYRAIMGFGPNRVSKDLPAYLFVNPKNQNLLQVKERWDPRFSQLHEKYLKESPSGHLGFSMACLVIGGWGVHPLRNLKKQGILVRRNDLGNQEIQKYGDQWESVYPYFTEMNPEIFYPLESPRWRKD